MTPEKYKEEILKNITSFLREERFFHWKLSDIQIVEAAIEAAYDAGKASSDAPRKSTVDNLNYLI